ncbi:Vegetative incompatibility protein HET-E-1 [Trametes pubescens]|uniref:Vegetative incompatibility protein HET-E-1 n=1 Tax=Trametes pubescens TaxID=154538 RepID=A0A1M2V936_TRAPU|nr:Vegetative incompatibility protein HET-E-1 [Trametes pubescens]
MPRFLDTSTGQFVWRETTGQSKAQYAYLSHFWGPDEATYQDVQRIQAGAVVTDSSLPYDDSGVVVASPIFSLLPDKIRFACQVARESGYRLLWIDACCLDRSNRLEMAESVHLTYELVKRANVCYVYLADVPDEEDPSAKYSYFRTSRWHTRCWTLQELIAPKREVFLTTTWRRLGTKEDLAETLAQITGVFPEMLSREVGLLSDVGVATRMSWAAGRQATRVEDRAYSLWGIFGVRMPPAYGEKTAAFLRLQEEIIKHTADHSIFAWGLSCTVAAFPGDVIRTPVQTHTSPRASTCLFARSALDFYKSDISPISTEEFATLLGRDPSARDFPSAQCFSDPQGVTARFLCIDLTDLPLLHQAIFALVDRQGCEACKGRGQARALALLQCRDSAGSLVALPLCGPPPMSGRPWREVTIGTHLPCSADPPHNPFRLVRLRQEAVDASLVYLLPEPIQVFFARHDRHDWPGRHLQQEIPSTPGPRLQERGLHFDLGRLSLTSSAESIPLAEESAFYLHTLGFTITPLRCRRREEEITLTTSLVSNFPHQSGTTNGQHLRLQVTLTEPRSDGCAKTEFSVANFIHTPESEEADTVLPQGCGHPPRHIIQKVPPVDHGAETRIVEPRTQLGPDQHDRIRAETSFMIRADASFAGQGERRVNVRQLSFRLTEYDRELGRYGRSY